MEFFISQPEDINKFPTALIENIVAMHGSYDNLNEKLRATCNHPEWMDKFTSLFSNGELDAYGDIKLTLYSGRMAAEVMTGIPQAMEQKDVAAMATCVRGIPYIALDIDTIMSNEMSENQLKGTTTLTLDHEVVHIEQMERGDLEFIKEGVMWKGDLYPAAELNANSQAAAKLGQHTFIRQQMTVPWEAEAYSRSMSWDLLKKLESHDKELSKIVSDGKRLYELCEKSVFGKYIFKFSAGLTQFVISKKVA